MINRQTLATADLQISLTKLLNRQKNTLKEIRDIKAKYERIRGNKNER